MTITRGALRARQLALFVLICLFVPVPAIGQVVAGTAMPQFALPYLNGGGEYAYLARGGISTIFYFWTPASGERTRDLCRLQEFSERRGREGFEVIAIVADPTDTADARRFVRDSALTYRNLVATQAVLADYGVGGILPTVVVLDEDRRVQQFARGGFNIARILSELPAPQKHNISQLPPGRAATSFIREPRRKSPVLYGLGGAALNAAVPGLGIGVFSGPVSRSAGAVTTIGFYAIGTFYLIDKAGANRQFLSAGDKRSYDGIVHGELVALGVCYALNVVVGFIAGVDHAR